MSAAIHLSRLGWDVEFADLMQGSGPDLIARKERKVVEVECKSVSVDAGRKIHQKQFIQLLKILWLVVDSASSESSGARVIQIELTDRLIPSNAFHMEIRDAVKLVLNGPLSENKSKEFSVSVSRNINATRRSNAHEASLRRKNSQTIVSVASKKQDKVLGTILYRLKTDSKKQFSQKWPALMLVQLQDLTNDQMKELKEAESPQGSGLQHLATRLIDRRPHLLALSFMNALECLPRTPLGVHSSQGLTYTFFNSKCPLQEAQISETELFIY